MFRVVFTKITVYNIVEFILYSLLKICLLFFCKFEQRFFEQISTKFFNVKLLIMNKKFMIECNFFIYIDRRLRVILTRFNYLFENINFFSCNNFIQLFFIFNIALYFKFYFKINIEKFAIRKFYKIFDEIIMLKQIISQQKNSKFVSQFCNTLFQLRNKHIFIEN